MYPQDFLFLFHGFLCVLVYGSSISHTRRGLGAGVTQVVDFDCPEEFGYYPHPTDCTQYYVCVFGGALLESCTGGLMYSHELQTCDWPRNVGCGESNHGGEGGTLSTVRVTDPRTRNPQQSQVSSGPQQSPAVQSQTPRSFQRQDYNRSRQHDVIQQQFYNEDIGPAEEIELDRQQRVYRGQPSNLGQVQRDREGLRPLKTNVNPQNVISGGAGGVGQDKISVVSFGSQRATAPRAQEQYSRTGYLQTPAGRIPYAIISQSDVEYKKTNYVNQPSPFRVVKTIYPSPFARSFGYYNLEKNEHTGKLTKPVLQSGFKPMHHFPVKEERKTRPEIQTFTYSQPLLRHVNLPDVMIVTQAPVLNLVSKSQVSPLTPVRTVSPIPKALDGGRYENVIHNIRFLPSPVDTKAIINATTYRSNHRPFYEPTTPYRTKSTANVTPSRLWVTTPRTEFVTASQPNSYTIEKPINQNYHQWPKVVDEGRTSYDGKRGKTLEYIAYVTPQKANDGTYHAEVYRDVNSQGQLGGVRAQTNPWGKDATKESKNFFGNFVKGPPSDVRAATTTTTTTTTHVPETIPIKGFYITEGTQQAGTTTELVRTETVTPEPFTKQKEYETENVYLSRRPTDDKVTYGLSHFEEDSRIEQVHQLTSALPQPTPTPRPVERYNTSQRFQPQFDQYYPVYDDVDIYRQNDYVQQYQTPSSTPSSNIAHQYRGQTTHKQALELAQAQQAQQAQEHAQQQQLRNTYTQDIYSPPPAVQDFNDQYNVQIDDQQYQHLAQTTPKLSSRSPATNSSKDSLTEATIAVSRASENVTTKSESAPIIRRSDSNTYFALSNFGPSTILLPPLRFDETTKKYFDPSYTKSDKPLFSGVIPALRDGTRNNFDPPKNGGALAKTFNSFDSLLSSFIAAVTGPTPTSTPSTVLPTPQPPKSSPETIVRSEIGRIHHDPIVITENFTIRLPNFKKPEVPQTTLVVPLPPPSSTPSTPPQLSQNDYLAYFVEIEPKKPKQEDTTTKRGGFYLNAQTEPTTEGKTQSSDPTAFGQNIRGGYTTEEEPKPKPYSDFVRLLSTGQNQKVRLGATLDLEPIAKPERKEAGPSEDEQQQAYHQPIGKWVIAKDGSSGKFAAPGRVSPFEAATQERQREHFRGTSDVSTEGIDRQRTREVETENLVQQHPSTEPELPPPTTIVSGPYKFVYVDLDSKTEELSSPSPFGRNPENEDRNRFTYKTNPEGRARARYFEKTRDPPQPKEISVQVTTTEVPITYTPNFGNDDSFKFIYKTNPETRLRNRFLGNSPTVLDDKKSEETDAPSRIIVPKLRPEAQTVAGLDDKPIRVLSVEDTSDEEEGEEVEDTAPESILPKRRKPDFRQKTVDVEPTTRKPYRYKSTTESQESDSENSSEENRKQLPRRVVKVHRNELKNQRATTVSKLKRLRKPLVKPSPSPIVVLEDLEEKTLSKENEIHPSYRPIVVTEAFFPGTNKTRFRFTVEDEKDFTEVPTNKISPTEKVSLLGKPVVVPVDSDNDVPEREVTITEKPFTQNLKRPDTYKNVTQFENRATTKAYRGKFKPSDSVKLRLKPTTASPDSESTPGPHLSTRQPGGYTIGSTGNEVTVNRGTPAPNRGTRPTLKPSTAIVSKASEFIDIYRYPPRRPDNVYATPTPDKSAAKCRKDVCLLPDCNCGGKDIPGDFAAEEIPQLVLLTFDDSVNDLNKGLYADLFERGRVNPNGCPISATFYVSHEWTDYSQVQNLYANGHEIASHSITHSFGEQFSQKKWTKEIAGQREILAAYGGVRLEDIRGMRAPFLAVGGNKMFKMLYDSNFTYDSSMPIYENRPPSWPYTLDYKLFHDCMIPPCPTKSYPGVWEVPMVMWQDLNGGRCSMGDACSNPPTADGVYKMLIKNFERHFTTNRAPFGLYYHAAWFTHEHHKEGFIAFLDTIVNMPEVWLVTTTQAIEWVRNPQPLSTVQSFPPFQCNVEKAKKCNNPKVCNLWHKSGVRYMRTCQPCPEVYPWTGKTGVRNSRVDNDIAEE